MLLREFAAMLAFLVLTRSSWVFSDWQLKLPNWISDSLVLSDQLKAGCLKFLLLPPSPSSDCMPQVLTDLIWLTYRLYTL